MSNIKNYTFNKLDFRLNNSEYWDFYLNSDAIKNSNPYSDNLIASFDFSTYGGFGADFSQPDFLEGDFNMTQVSIISSVGWDGAYSSDFSGDTFGLTGLDNGRIPYDGSSDDYGHTGLLTLLTGTTLVHTSTSNKLVLNQVSGSTGDYVYPSGIEFNNEVGNYMYLRGGFLQGYYKLDGVDYQVLPNRYQKGWTISTWLNKDDSGVTGTILNDTYPDNKGFFYYIGTRAENKFWNIFTGNTTGVCNSGSTDFCMESKETDIHINNIVVDGDITDISVPLSPPPRDIKKVTNKFLIFGRSNGKLCNNRESEGGFGRQRAHDYNPDIPFYSNITGKEQSDFRNQFLIFGRSNGKLCNNRESEGNYGRQRAHDYSGSTTPILELDKDADIVDNAIGFRIKDDGSIGYRLLTLSADCKSVEVIEEYSMSGMVTDNQWEHVVVKWVNNDTYTECELETNPARKGKLKFYLNSNLIFTSKTLNEFIGKRLDDWMEKQLGVPYNVSIGGGTQGLIESMTFDGVDAEDLGLIIESNFAGSFIGGISTFDMFDSSLSWCEIKDIYKNKVDNYK